MEMSVPKITVIRIAQVRPSILSIAACRWTKWFSLISFTETSSATNLSLVVGSGIDRSY